MKSLMTGIIEHLRYRFRMCIWKHWKKPMTKYNELRKLGILEYNVYMAANTRRGYYQIASTVMLHIAISNKRVKKRTIAFARQLPYSTYCNINLTEVYKNRICSGMRGIK